MKRYITKFCKEYDTCQRSKPSTQNLFGKLTPLDTPCRPWEHISMDLIVELPLTADGYCNILSIVDRFLKYCVFVPLKHDTTATTIADAFLANVVRQFGVPKSIVSDRDKRFQSKFWKHLLTGLGV